MEPITLDALTALEPLLSEEELMARDTVRKFVAEKVLPDIGMVNDTRPAEAGTADISQASAGFAGNLTIPHVIGKRNGAIRANSWL